MTTLKKKHAAKALNSPKTTPAAYVAEHAETGPWWTTMQGIVQAVLLFFAATLPLYYDLAVPEVSGDIRWAATTFFAGLAGVLLLSSYVWRGRTRLSLRWPVLMWIAVGLLVWMGVSMIDAINPSRGIQLIKAMMSQMVLMTAVYMVATPAFCRKLLWAMVLPLALTCIIGIMQFHQMNDAAMWTVLDTPVGFDWFTPFALFTPVLWAFDQLGGLAAGYMGWDDRHLGITGFITNFFLQSAVPGSTFANKNLAGSWTAMMLPIALYLLLTAKRWPAQALASMLLGLGTLFLIYSRARASWVALFAALMVMGALMLLVPAWRQALMRHIDIKHGGWLLVPVVIVALWGGNVSPVQGSYAIDRSPTQQVAALAQSSWNEIGGRLAYNLNSTVITKDYWFNGVGLGNFYTIYPPYYDAIVVTPWNSYNVMARPQRTHTDMMQAFTETGILGGILYVSLFVCGIVMALRLAGRRAGALGGYLIGAGMMTMVMALTVFLEFQNMLSMPSPWNMLVVGGMLAFVIVMLYGALRSWRKVSLETAAADDIQLMGLMAGISLLAISINALMDFPMQLPTAPASAAMLLGIICAIHIRRNPTALVGPVKVIGLGRAGMGGVLVVFASVWGVGLWDAYIYREANAALKQGMIRIYSGINDDTTLAQLEYAHMLYPYDQRIQEHIAVAYANYNGNLPIGIDARIAKLEWALTGDPWGANHMVNLAGLYLQKAAIAQQQGQVDEAKKYFMLTNQLFEKLKKNADFSHFTWGIGGTLYSMIGQTNDAIWMFQRALTIEPGYAPAQTGLQNAISRSQQASPTHSAPAH